MLASFPLSPSKKLEQSGNWTDGEERMIDRIKATLPDAELALWAMEGFGVEGKWGGGGGRKGEKAVHQRHVCVNVCVYGGEETKANYIVAHGAPHGQKCAFGDN